MKKGTKNKKIRTDYYLSLAFKLIDTVDGRNPAPPEMYKTS